MNQYSYKVDKNDNIVITRTMDSASCIVKGNAANELYNKLKKSICKDKILSDYDNTINKEQRS